MSWLAQHWLHLLFILAYLALLAHHAWKGKQTTHSLSDFLVAGRSMKGWIIALSFYATFMSTNTFIGSAGKSWDVGLIWCIGIFILSGLCCAAWFLVAPKFVPLTKQYGSLTVADFLGYRYGSIGVRRTAAVIVLVSSIIYLVAIFKGSAIALQLLLNLPYSLAAILIFLVVTGYTLTGGFRSVVLTDAVQGSLMLLGAVALIAVTLYKGGGLNEMLVQLKDRDPALVSWRGNMPLATIIALSLAVGIKYMVEPRQLSRFYGLKDRAALRTAAIIAPIIVFLTYICLMPMGALAHAIIPANAIDSSDKIVPYLLSTTQIFGPALSSLFLLVLLSAAMSSIDSVLLVAASSIEHDLVAKRVSDKKAINRTRIWIALLSFLSMACALNPYTDDIVTITSLSGSFYAACFFPTLVVGLYWTRGNSIGALLGMVSGATIVVAWYIARRNQIVDLHEVYVGMLVGLFVYIGASLIANKR